MILSLVFFFQAEDGIRYLIVTGVQTCAFFFSSRRRHTRSDRDWSSDVCSSDLVDEFYDWLVVRPVRAGSEKVLWRAVDAGLIDGGLVNGTARATAGVGGILRRMQSGNVRSYAAWVLLGAVLWLGYIFFR